MKDDSRRVRRAFAIAPLAGPLAVFAGVVIRSAITHAIVRNAAPNNLEAELFFLWLFALFGAPASYAGAIIVLWPVTALLRRLNLIKWWTLTAAAALIGAVVLTLYKTMLLPRGSFDLFPGDGFVAGGAVGFTLWLIGFRTLTMRGALAAPGSPE